VVFAAMPFLMDSIETALIRLSFRLQTGQTPPGFGLIGMPTAFVSWWHDSLHLVWERSFLLIGGLGIAGYVVGRRKLPGWFLTALLAVAWLTAYEALTRLFSPWVFLLIARSSGRPIGNNAVGILISAVVFLLPRFVLYSVPAAVAFREGLHGKARQTWLEWTGLALAVALFLVAEPTELIRNYSVSGSGEPWAMEIIVREAALLAAIFIGFFLAGSSRAANRRNPQFPS
jgi:hypothetical protein